MPVRCLIVDDDETFVRAARELLADDGIDVVGAVSTGAQAYRTCGLLRPDVALVDVNLGTESGFDVARLLADLAEAGPPRVILISASAGDDVADLIADSAAVSFLHKERLSGAAIRGILAQVSLAAALPQRDSR